MRPSMRVCALSLALALVCAAAVSAEMSKPSFHAMDKVPLASFKAGEKPHLKVAPKSMPRKDASAKSAPADSFDQVPAQRGLFGVDSRRDEYQVRPQFKVYGEATSLMVNKGELVQLGTGYYFNETSYLWSHGACQEERFVNQTVNFGCTAFLISPTQLATDSQCLKLYPCGEAAFIFDYISYSDTYAPGFFDGSNVYTCTFSYDVSEDFLSIIHLDRAVPNRTPLKFSKTPVSQDEHIAVIGYPNGLPRKYSGNGRVAYVDPNYSFMFYGELDVSGFNSGSPVFRFATREVVGVLRSQSFGMAYDPDAYCFRTVRCSYIGQHTDCYPGPIFQTIGMHVFANTGCSSDSDCNSHQEGYWGYCNMGTCSCNTNRYGSDCSYYATREMCSDHGNPIGLLQCSCDPGYEGQWCQDEIGDIGYAVLHGASPASGLYGFSVSAAGNRFAVGEPACLNSSDGCDGGAVTIYEFDGSDLHAIGYISNPEETADAYCGYNVFFTGDNVLISCKAATISEGVQSHVVYYFEYINNEWEFVDFLIPPEGPRTSTEFGSVTLVNDEGLIVADPLVPVDGFTCGVVYLYSPDEENPNWNNEAYPLIPHDCYYEDHFGRDFALSGDYLAVSNEPNYRYSAVYVYYFGEEEPVLVNHLMHYGSAKFGIQISMTDTELVIGNPSFSDVAPSSGSIHVYSITGDGAPLAYKQTVVPFYNFEGQGFGFRVVAKGETMAVFSAFASDHPSDFAGFTLFERQDEGYYFDSMEGTDLLPGGSALGHSMDISDIGVIIGAPLESAEGFATGATLLIPWGSL